MKDLEKNIRTLNLSDESSHMIEEYGLIPLVEVPEVHGDRINIDENSDKLPKDKKFVPETEHTLRSRMVLVPEAIYKCSGIKILGKRIKSLLFTTDVSIICNSNANAVMAVYPFTPQLSITKAILDCSSVPVFVGVGGGQTTGIRSQAIALQAELMGAHGVVVNAPMASDMVEKLASTLDIPVVVTVGSEDDDYLGKIKAGAQILNVSGGPKTAEIVRTIRSKIGYEFPIIATGGPNEKSILETIEAGANAITYTPPSSAEIFADIMVDYRKDKKD